MTLIPKEFWPAVERMISDPRPVMFGPLRRIVYSPRTINVTPDERAQMNLLFRLASSRDPVIADRAAATFLKMMIVDDPQTVDGFAVRF